MEFAFEGTKRINEGPVRGDMSSRERLEVGGMHCSSCAETIGDAVEAVDGVESASVNYATDDATVEYDPDRASLSAVYEAIESVGYEPRRERRTIKVAGMHCANCSETVEGALADLPGVVRADVNYATDEATVEYTPETFSIEAVYDAIADVGYEPVRGGDDEGSDGSPAERELRKQRRLVLGGFVLTAPFVYLMATMVTGLPRPETVAGVPLGWLEFAVATVLMATLGREFLPAV
jgi:Cu+-exporting ATPase